MPIASLLLIVFAGFEVTPLLGDHAVVQQQQPIPVWGTGEPGDTIDVRLSGKSPLANSTTVLGDGSWFVELGRLPASATPLTLTVTDGADTWTAHDVLVGELWLASGQSNMEWRVGQSDDRNATASEFTNTSIREFKVPHAEEPFAHSGVVDDELLLGMVKLFTVPKADPSKLRMVVDARPINDQMTPPPRFSLKSPAQLAASQ